MRPKPNLIWLHNSKPITINKLLTHFHGNYAKSQRQTVSILILTQTGHKQIAGGGGKKLIGRTPYYAVIKCAVSPCVLAFVSFAANLRLMNISLRYIRLRMKSLIRAHTNR
jgi:hypothetical protein